MDYQEIVAAELIAHDIVLCTGCSNGLSHNRGWAYSDTREIHYSKKCATRATLYGFLHEVGHIVREHGKKCKLPRWAKEQQAEEYAQDSFRQYGLTIPRTKRAHGTRYVSRMKRWGRNISRGRMAIANGGH